MSRLLLSLIAVCAFAQKPDYVYGIRNKPFVDAREFGLSTSASSATNSAAINSALAACPVVASFTACAVMLPVGNFNVAGGIVVTGSQRLIGSGQYATVLTMTVPNASVITLGSVAVSSLKAAIEDLSIESNTTSASTSGYGVVALSSYECDIRRVTISGYGGLHGGLYIDGANHLFVDRLFISNLATHGTSSPGTAIGVTCQSCPVLVMSNSTIGDASYLCKDAFEIRNGEAIYLRDTETAGFLRGMSINPGSGQAVHWPRFDNLQLDFSVNGALYIEPTGTGSVDRLRCIDCWLSSSSAGVGLSIVTSSSVSNIEFIGGIIANNYQDGVYLDAPNLKGLTFTGGLAHGNNQAAAFFSGIHVVNVGTMKVSGMRIGDDVSAATQYAGISAGAGSTGTVGLVGNDLTGNTSPIFLDAASSVALTSTANTPTGQIFRPFDEAKTPATSSAACKMGEITFDTTYLYICIAANTQKRIALGAF